MAARKSSRNRVGIRLDSLFVAGRIATDTLAFGLDQLSIRERHKEMQLHAKAKALLAAMPLGKIRTASVTELAAVKGIGVGDAERIAKYFEEKRGKKK